MSYEINHDLVEILRDMRDMEMEKFLRTEPNTGELGQLYRDKLVARAKEEMRGEL